MSRLLLAAVALVATSPAFAQTSVPEKAPVNTVVAMKVDRAFPAGSKVKYRWVAPTLSIGEGTADNKTAYATGATGVHPWSLTLAWIEGDALQLETHNGTIAFGDTPAPTPTQTLAEKAGPKAAVLSEGLADLKASLNRFTTTAQVLGYLDLLFAQPLVAIPPTHPAAVEIVERVNAAVSGNLTDASRKSLDAALAKAISDLGTKPPEPPVPPVVEGKRTVVVIHENDDLTQEMADLKVNTANNSAAAKYFRDHGHTVRFLEEEQLDSAGNPLKLVEDLKALGVGVPAVFILDAGTGAVIYKQKLDAGATADNLVEYTKRSGG